MAVTFLFVPDRQTDRQNNGPPKRQATDATVSDPLPSRAHPQHPFPPAQAHRRHHTRANNAHETAGPHNTHATRQVPTSLFKHMRAHTTPSHASDTGTHRDPPSDARTITYRN